MQPTGRRCQQTCRKAPGAHPRSSTDPPGRMIRCFFCISTNCKAPAIEFINNNKGQWLVFGVCHIAFLADVSKYKKVRNYLKSWAGHILKPASFTVEKIRRTSTHDEFPTFKKDKHKSCSSATFSVITARPFHTNASPSRTKFQTPFPSSLIQQVDTWSSTLRNTGKKITDTLNSPNPVSKILNPKFLEFSDRRIWW